MTAEQRQGLIEWAWRYAQPIIRRWECRRPGLDYEGFVAERLSQYIDTFDGGMASLKTWAGNHAHGACLDAERRDTGVIKFGRHAGRKGIMQLQTMEMITDNGRREPPSCLDVLDAPGHLEQMDAFRDLLRGCSKVERLILIGYYVQDQTMREVGQSLSLSESRVSQLHTALLGRLRERLGDRAPAA